MHLFDFGTTALAFFVVGSIAIQVFLAVFIDRLNASFPPINENLQLARHIVHAQKQLDGAERVDIGVRVPSHFLNQLIAKVEADLKESEELASDGVLVESVLVELQNQAIKVTLVFRKTFDKVTVTTEAVSYAAISAEEDKIFLSIVFDRLHVRSIKVDEFVFDLNPLVSLINTGLKRTMRYINGVVDERVNPIQIQLMSPEIINTTTTDLAPNDPDYSIPSKQIYWRPAVTSLYLLITDEEISFQASLTNLGPTDSAPGVEIVPPSLPDGEYSDEEIKQLFATYSSSYWRTAEQNLGDDVLTTSKRTSAAISKEYLARTLGDIFNGGETARGTMNVAVESKTFQKDLELWDKLFWLSCADRNFGCSREVGDACDNQSRCRTQVCDTVTRKVCWLAGPLKEFCRKVTNKVCRLPGDAVCRLAREADRVIPNLCRILIEEPAKLSCDVMEAINDFSCTAQSALALRLNQNLAFGNLAGTVGGSGRVSAQIHSLRADRTLDAIEVELSASALADIQLNLAYDPLIAGRLVCVKKWDEEIQARATATIDRENIRVELHTENTDNHTARLRFSIPERTQDVFLDRHPYELLFKYNPSLVLNCRTAAIPAHAIYVWDEKIAPRFENNPVLIGKQFEVSVDRRDFNIDVSGFVLRLPDVTPISLDPVWATKAISFREVSPSHD